MPDPRGAFQNQQYRLMRNSALTKNPIPFALLIGLVGLFIFVLPQVASAKEPWEPIPAEDLAAKECQSYPGSSAEFLFEHRMLNGSGNGQQMEEDLQTFAPPSANQTMQFYQRIKIYSAKGATDAGVLGIEYPDEHQVWNLAARVTKPDGGEKHYTKKDFTESIVAKKGADKVKKLTIAIPDLGSGDILEYIWTQSVSNQVNSYQWWYCQRTLPVREFVFWVKSSGQDCSLSWFNVSHAEIASKGKYKGRLVIRDLAPYEDEPLRPPERDVRGWYLVFYKDSFLRYYNEKDELLKLISLEYEEDFRLRTKPNGAIKAKAAELTKGLSSDEEKLKALYNFTQGSVTNFDYFKSAELLAAKEKLDKKDREQLPDKTLTLRTGYTAQVNDLFASLAKAAGYDVRLAWSASRYSTLNVKHQNGWLFLNDRVVVIRLKDASRYYAPGDFYVPAGMLHRSNEAAPCLILDANKVIFETNPIATADKSPVQRKGRFTLDAEGNLEGEVELTMFGHAGASRKQDWAGKQLEEIETDFRQAITERMAAAEVSDLKWENLLGNTLPLIARYKIKVPAYADLAGSKAIFSPNVFEHGAKPVFTSEKRKCAIYFPFAWSERDDIEIALPEGYTLDAGSAPTNVGDILGAVGVSYKAGFKSKSRKIVYQRNFALGGDGSIAFQAQSYPALKQIFDAINRSDEHTIVIKQIEPAPVSAPAPVAAPEPAAP